MNEIKSYKIISSLLILTVVLMMTAYICKQPSIPTSENQILVFVFKDHEYLKFKDTIIHCASCTNIVHSFPWNTNQ